MSGKSPIPSCFVCGLIPSPTNQIVLRRHGDIWLCPQDEAAADAVLLDSDASGSRYFREAMESAQDAQS